MPAGSCCPGATLPYLVALDNQPIIVVHLLDSVCISYKMPLLTVWLSMVDLRGWVDKARHQNGMVSPSWDWLWKMSLLNFHII